MKIKFLRCLSTISLTLTSTFLPIAGATSAVESPNLDVTTLSMGGDNVCVIAEDKSARCGTTSSGRSDISAPGDLGPVLSIAVGGSNACAITVGRQARCWGSLATNINEVPQNLGPVNAIAVTSEFACGINESNKLVCWGNNWGSPIEMPASLGAIKQVSANQGYICVIETSDFGRCWKANTSYEDGFVLPKTLGKVKQLEFGGDALCVLDFNARTLCMKGTEGALQQSDFWDSLPAAKSLAVNTTKSCIITQLGFLTCWTWIRNQAGTKMEPRILPQRNNLNESYFTVLEVASSDYGNVCAIWEEGKLSCFTWDNRLMLKSLAINENSLNLPLFTPKTHSQEPSISNTGSFAVGKAINVKVTNWDQNYTPHYQWLRDGKEIRGEIGSTYQIKIEDIGSRISTRVAGAKYGYLTFSAISSGVLVSKATLSGSPCSDPKKKTVEAWADVTQWKGTKSQPSISGKVEYGQSIKGSNGTWTKGLTLCSFWMSNNNVFLANTKGTHIITGQEVGKSLRLVVIGKNKAGVATVRYSPEFRVSKAQFPKYTFPKLGTVQVGKKIVLNPNWVTGTKYTFEWGTSLLGTTTGPQTSNSYTPTPEQRGLTIDIAICGSHPYYLDYCIGTPTKPVLAPEMPKIGKVAISQSSLKSGSTLKGVTSGWMEGVEVTSQWIINGKPIISATDPELVIQPNYRGSTVAFRVLVKLFGYEPITLVSAGVKIP